MVVAIGDGNTFFLVVVVVVEVVVVVVVVVAVVVVVVVAVVVVVVGVEVRVEVVVIIMIFALRRLRRFSACAGACAKEMRRSRRIANAPDLANRHFMKTICAYM